MCETGISQLKVHKSIDKVHKFLINSIEVIDAVQKKNNRFFDSANDRASDYSLILAVCNMQQL